MEFNKELEAKHEEILNDIKKNLADVSKESNLLNREMYMAFAMLHENKIHGKFEYINEKGHASMEVKMNKYGLIQMVHEIAKSARKISQKAQNDKIILEEKPVTLAMNEMAYKVENNIK